MLLNDSPAQYVQVLMPARTSFRAVTLLVAALAVALARPLGAQSSDTLRLGLEEAVTRVLRSSDEARIANAQVDLLDAQVLSARAAGLPQVRLFSSYTQVIQNARADIVGQVFNQRFNYATNLQVQQSLFQGGRVLSASQAASRSERAAIATREETRAQLAVAMQRTYLNVVFTARLLEIQRRNLVLADERLGQTEQLERAGRASRYEVLRARVERANIEPLVRQAESDQELAELELRRLLDLPLDQPLLLTSDLDATRVRALADAAVATTTPPGVRAAVRAAEATASARVAAIRVARADLLPSFNLTFTTGYLALPRVNGFPTIFEQQNGWYPDQSFGFFFNWPLFDGLRAKGAIDLAQAQAQLADLELRRVREDATVDVARAEAELARARSVALARETTVREAEEAFELASLRFARGIGTQLEVSDAQLAMLTARSTDARATFDLYLAVAELARVRAEPIPLPEGGSVSTRISR